MASDYTTLEAVASDLGMTGVSQNELLSVAITAASRQVDDWCGRRFWQDPSVVAREFFPDGSATLDLLDQAMPCVEISTTTGLIVKTDDGTGTFGTTLTINTNFLLGPRNAAADSRPYSTLLRIDDTWPALSSGRAGVQITARWGWATIPDQVERATRIQAALLWKSKDTPLGVAQMGEVAAVSQRAALHPVARALLGPYQLAPIG